MPVGRGDTLPSFARIKRPRWRPVGLNDRHLQSHGKIGDCEQSNFEADHFTLQVGEMGEVHFLLVDAKNGGGCKHSQKYRAVTSREA